MKISMQMTPLLYQSHELNKDVEEDEVLVEAASCSCWWKWTFQ
jgi:hypothetical protein